MNSGNPTLSADKFREAARQRTGSKRMTIDGTLNRIFMLFVLLLGTSILSWNLSPTAQKGAIAIGGLGGLILALVTVFKQEWAPVTAPLYALMEGLMVGAVSYMCQAVYQGIVLQAVGLTLGILAVMLILYRARIIKVTQKFRFAVVAATGGIALVYMVSIGMQLFGGMQMPYLHSSGPVGIGISLFIVGVAALNLTLDFDLIERGAESDAPKYMEWYGAFALMVTIIWLYLEILRLLMKIRE